MKNTLIAILLVTITLVMPVMVLAQDADDNPPDMTQPVIFVSGEGTFDHFLNNILNEVRVVFLALVLPGMGLVTVGTGLFKRFIPNQIPSDWIAFGIMGVLFTLYYLAGNLEQGESFQVVVDFLTQVGGLLLVAGVTKVGSSAFYNQAKKYDKTLIGYQRTQLSNG